MELEQKAVELIEQLQALAQPAADLAIAAVQAAAIINIVKGFLALPIVYLLVKLTKHLFRKCSETRDGTDIACGVGGVMALFATVALSAVAFFTLFDTGNWLALLSPEMALAYKVIGP